MWIIALILILTLTLLTFTLALILLPGFRRATFFLLAYLVGHAYLLYRNATATTKERKEKRQYLESNVKWREYQAKQQQHQQHSAMNGNTATDEDGFDTAQKYQHSTVANSPSERRRKFSAPAPYLPDHHADSENYPSSSSSSKSSSSASSPSRHSLPRSTTWASVFKPSSSSSSSKSKHHRMPNAPPLYTFNGKVVN